MERILINSKQCEWIDNGFRQYWKVTMPSSTSYFGYAFEISPYYLGETDNKDVMWLTKPKKEGFVFVLTKIDREPGMRYARPKLSWEELCKELADHSARNDKNNLPQGLAFLYDYDYKHGHEMWRDGHYAIGGVEGCWFYENGTKKRRISAKNFRLLRMLETDEVESVRAQLKRLKKINDEISDIDSIAGQFNCYIKVKIEQHAESLKDASKEFLSQIDKAREKLNKESSDIIEELENPK